MASKTSRVISVRVQERKLNAWREAATGARSFNAWVVRALDEAASLERALARQAARERKA